MCASEDIHFFFSQCVSLILMCLMWLQEYRQALFFPVVIIPSALVSIVWLTRCICILATALPSLLMSAFRLTRFICKLPVVVLLAVLVPPFRLARVFSRFIASLDKVDVAAEIAQEEAWSALPNTELETDEVLANGNAGSDIEPRGIETFMHRLHFEFYCSAILSLIPTTTDYISVFDCEYLVLRNGRVVHQELIWFILIDRVVHNDVFRFEEVQEDVEGSEGVERMGRYIEDASPRPEDMAAVVLANRMPSIEPIVSLRNILHQVVLPRVEERAVVLAPRRSAFRLVMDATMEEALPIAEETTIVPADTSGALEPAMIGKDDTNDDDEETSEEEAFCKLMNHPALRPQVIPHRRFLLVFYVAIRHRRLRLMSFKIRLYPVRIVSLRYKRAAFIADVGHGQIKGSPRWLLLNAVTFQRPAGIVYVDLFPGLEEASASIDLMAIRGASITSVVTSELHTHASADEGVVHKEGTGTVEEESNATAQQTVDTSTAATVSERSKDASGGTEETRIEGESKTKAELKGNSLDLGSSSLILSAFSPEVLASYQKAQADYEADNPDWNDGPDDDGSYFYFIGESKALTIPSPIGPALIPGSEAYKKALAEIFDDSDSDETIGLLSSPPSETSLAPQNGANAQDQSEIAPWTPLNERIHAAMRNEPMLFGMIFSGIENSSEFSSQPRPRSLLDEILATQKFDEHFEDLPKEERQTIHDIWMLWNAGHRLDCTRVSHDPDSDSSSTGDPLVEVFAAEAAEPDEHRRSPTPNPRRRSGRFRGMGMILPDHARSQFFFDDYWSEVREREALRPLPSVREEEGMSQPEQLTQTPPPMEENIDLLEMANEILEEAGIAKIEVVGALLSSTYSKEEAKSF